MPCEPVIDEKTGNVIGIKCSRDKPARGVCIVCGKPSTRLCDYLLENGNTCDAPLCTEHANKRGWADFCPEHAEKYDQGPK